MTQRDSTSGGDRTAGEEGVAMRRIELLLIVLTLAATSAAHAGWVRDSVLDYEP